jgi:hypothetical protein
MLSDILHQMKSVLKNKSWWNAGLNLVLGDVEILLSIFIASVISPFLCL